MLSQEQEQEPENSIRFRPNISHVGFMDVEDSASSDGRDGHERGEERTRFFFSRGARSQFMQGRVCFCGTARHG